MFLISHRGNLDGKNENKENHPDYIEEALDKNYDVEIDVWNIFNNYFLGHDNPDYPIKKDFLKNNKLWCHAKNIDAIDDMLKNNIHCFWHEEDTVTLTSKGYIWTYPGKQLTNNSICVLPEIQRVERKYLLSHQNNPGERQCAGICSDYIIKYKE